VPAASTGCEAWKPTRSFTPVSPRDRTSRRGSQLYTEPVTARLRPAPPSSPNRQRDQGCSVGLISAAGARKGIDHRTDSACLAKACAISATDSQRTLPSRAPGSACVHRARRRVPSTEKDHAREIEALISRPCSMLVFARGNRLRRPAVRRPQGNAHRPRRRASVPLLDSKRQSALRQAQ
jgi:hypothetical protein